MELSAQAVSMNEIARGLRAVVEGNVKAVEINRSGNNSVN